MKAKATKRGTLVVPGGWEIHVPHVEVSREDPKFQAIVSALQSAGASPLHADEFAREGIVRLFRGRWKTATLQHVQRAAEAYVDSFGVLDADWRPEIVERIFIPHSSEIWRGDPNYLLRKAFQEMKR